jgi:hypothetical protein
MYAIAVNAANPVSNTKLTLATCRRPNTYSNSAGASATTVSNPSGADGSGVNNLAMMGFHRRKA